MNIDWQRVLEWTEGWEKYQTEPDPPLPDDAILEAAWADLKRRMQLYNRIFNSFLVSFCVYLIVRRLGWLPAEWLRLTDWAMTLACIGWIVLQKWAATHIEHFRCPCLRWPQCSSRCLRQSAFLSLRERAAVPSLPLMVLGARPTTGSD